MESNDETRSSRKKEKNTLKRNSLVFAFFLLLSFILWYLNSLGKDLETDIRYPVRYLNIPLNRALPADTPSRLSLFLQGPGYSILKLKITGTKSPVEIDLSKMNQRRYLSGGSSDYYILTADLVKNFNAQLKATCKVVSVKPDTLFLISHQTK